MKQYKDSQICSIFVGRMMSKTSTFDGIESIISKRYAFRCDFGRIAQVKILGFSVQLKTVLALYEQETVRNNGQTSHSRLKTSVRLHIDP